MIAVPGSASKMMKANMATNLSAFDNSTINNSTKTLKKNFLQFLNPCFRERIIKVNKELVHKKNFNNGLDIVFVGRVEKNKGIDHIFEIFQRIGQMI